MYIANKTKNVVVFCLIKSKWTLLFSLLFIKYLSEYHQNIGTCTIINGLLCGYGILGRTLPAVIICTILASTTTFNNTFYIVQNVWYAKQNSLGAVKRVLPSNVWSIEQVNHNMTGKNKDWYQIAANCK